MGGSKWKLRQPNRTYPISNVRLQLEKQILERQQREHGKLLREQGKFDMQEKHQQEQQLSEGTELQQSVEDQHQRGLQTDEQQQQQQTLMQPYTQRKRPLSSLVDQRDMNFASGNYRPGLAPHPRYYDYSYSLAEMLTKLKKQQEQLHSVQAHEFCLRYIKQRECVTENLKRRSTLGNSEWEQLRRQKLAVDEKRRKSAMIGAGGELKTEETEEGQLSSEEGDLTETENKSSTTAIQAQQQTTEEEEEDEEEEEEEEEGQQQQPKKMQKSKQKTKKAKTDPADLATATTATTTTTTTTGNTMSNADNGTDEQ